MQIPDKTVEACRNFWFHPGDGSTMDEDGFAYFIDRIKDCVRRRGEDISSFQVEQVIAEHPAVAEVAAISKVQKNPLRQRKITARTWDRQARRQG